MAALEEYLASKGRWCPGRFHKTYELLMACAGSRRPCAGEDFHAEALLGRRRLLRAAAALPGIGRPGGALDSLSWAFRVVTVMFHVLGERLELGFLE